jgi:flagellar hook assembly protein FlgD
MIIALPQRYELLGNYPNPFNQQTVIRFTVPNSSPVTITIYDGLGRIVRELSLLNLPAGTHSVQWNGTDDKGKSVASGIYFYRMKAGSFVQIKRMIMIK